MRVQMVDDQFIPDHLTLQAGVAYRLHLENRGSELHEFTAPEFFRASTVRQPERLANGGKELVLQPGESADLDVIPQRLGHYALSCADHDWDGMVGSIDVR